MSHKIRHRHGQWEVIAPDGTICCKKGCKLDAEREAERRDKRIKREGK